MADRADPPGSRRSRPEYMSLWAGHAAALATRRPAAALLQALIMQTEQAFERLR
ncbi:MAG: hypothetical protein H7338_06990 [Candidatus Sericytochromatia bacterium]|nr:hypothetical protein [Candidatus Sericytochromatia bacterium]